MNESDRNHNDRYQLDARTVEVICTLIVLDMLLALFIGFILGMPIAWAILLTTLVWTWVVLGSAISDWFFVDVPPLRHFVLGSPFQAENATITSGNKLSETPWASTLREVYPGFRGKWPWEQVIRIYNTERMVEISGSLTVYTQEEIPYEITWQTFLTPLSGCLVNLAGRHEPAVVDYLRGRFESSLISGIKKVPDAQFFEELTNAKEKLAKMFGGKDEVTPEEKLLGIFTGNLQITAARRSKDYEKAAAMPKAAKKYNEAIEALDQLPPQQRAAFLAAMQGKGRVDYINIEGLSGD